MAVEPQQNDSIISVGFDLAEETEKSASEIAAGVDQAPAEAAPQAQQEASGQDQAALREAQELAAAARDHEAAERAQQLEQSHELERDGQER